MKSGDKGNSGIPVHGHSIPVGGTGSWTILIRVIGQDYEWDRVGKETFGVVSENGGQGEEGRRVPSLGRRRDVPERISPYS